MLPSNLTKPGEPNPCPISVTEKLKLTVLLDVSLDFNTNLLLELIAFPLCVILIAPTTGKTSSVLITLNCTLTDDDSLPWLSNAIASIFAPLVPKL